MAATTVLPLPQLSFDVTLPGINVGKFTECSGLAAEVEVLEYKEGGNNEFVHKLPTRVKYPNLVLKYGVTDEEALLEWFRKTHLEARQIDMTITLVNFDGQARRRWSFPGAYPVKWTGPTLNAKSNEIAMETLEVAHQGLRAA